MPWNKFLAQSSQAGSVVGLPRQSSLLSSGGMRYATPLPLMSGSFEPASFTSHGGRVSASPLARRHRQSGNLLEKIDLELGTEEEDEEKYLGSIQQGYKDYTNDNINMFEHFVPGNTPIPVLLVRLVNKKMSAQERKLVHRKLKKASGSTKSWKKSHTTSLNL